MLVYSMLFLHRCGAIVMCIPVITYVAQIICDVQCDIRLSKLYELSKYVLNVHVVCSNSCNTCSARSKQVKDKDQSIIVMKYHLFLILATAAIIASASDAGKRDRRRNRKKERDGRSAERRDRGKKTKYRENDNDNDNDKRDGKRIRTKKDRKLRMGELLGVGTDEWRAMSKSSKRARRQEIRQQLNEEKLMDEL